MPAADSLVSDQDIDGIYRDHHGWLRGWLRSRLGCSETAADLAQDTFVRLLVSSTQKHFNTAAQTRSYLKVAAKNLCINLWRRQEIERAWQETLAASPEEHYPSTERQAMVLQALEEISAMLHALPAKTAKAFLLAVVCQMTDDAVGAELGISGRMVRKHVAKAMLACLQLQAHQTMTELAHAE